jgi:hypothetical protein
MSDRERSIQSLKCSECNECSKSANDFSLKDLRCSFKQSANVTNATAAESRFCRCFVRVLKTLHDISSRITVQANVLNIRAFLWAVWLSRQKLFPRPRHNVQDWMNKVLSSNRARFEEDLFVSKVAYVTCDSSSTLGLDWRGKYVAYGWLRPPVR